MKGIESLRKDAEAVAQIIDPKEKAKYEQKAKELNALFKEIADHQNHLKSLGLTEQELAALDLANHCEIINGEYIWNHSRKHIEEMYSSEQFRSLREGWLQLYDSAIAKLGEK